MDKKKDIIPYLLNLAAKSDAVLKGLTQDIQEICEYIIVCVLFNSLGSGYVHQDLSDLLENVPSCNQALK